MTFLNPLILLGLAAAAVPLIIHLFNFRKPRKVEFSSLEFLKEVERSTMQRVRIKQWLLLALRTLAIAAMVLSFARPTIEGRLGRAFAGAAPAAVAVVIDNSASMELRDARGAYLDQAKAFARTLLSDTDTRDEVAVVTTAEPSAAVLGPGGTSALDRLDEIGIRAGGVSQLAAVTHAADLLQAAATRNRELYLISDLQRTTLLDSTQALVGGEVPVTVVPVGSGVVDNVAVRNVEVESRIVEADQPVRIAARLTNFGATEAASYVTSVFLDGERVAQSSADLSPGFTADVAFSVTPSRTGWLRGVVQTEDDAFPGDNRAYFTLNVPSERSVLLVAGERQDVRFLRAALAADPRVSLNVRVIPETDLAAEDPTRYDVVMLAGVASLSSGETARLSAYISGGGGVLFFPGDGGRVEDYNALLREVGAGTVESISGPAAGLATDALDRADLEHPLFRGVLDNTSGELERPAIYRRMTYRPGVGAESTILSLSSGGPFLQEIRAGSGTLLLMAVAPDPSWSDLPTRGLFIPLLYRSVFLLSSSETTTGENLVLNGGGELLLPGVTEGASILLRGPDGQESAPLTRTGIGGTVIVLDGLLTSAGHYAVLVDGTERRLLAVNPDTRESDLARYAAAEAVEALEGRSESPVHALQLEAGQAPSGRLLDARRGTELWNVFLALALLFLAAEMIVSRQWKPEQSSA